MALIIAKDVTKVYKVGKLTNEVLKGITLTVNEGDFVSIVGPSGSGKTTLLYVLGGLEEYTSGSVLLLNHELKDYKNIEKAQLRAGEIGYVFQFYNLVSNLTVYENVLLAAVLAKRNKKEDIIKVLAQVGMSDYLNYYPYQISGGMQQRVAIARCLIKNPKIIFADEPIGNLDYKNGLAIMELFRELNQKYRKTIIMVTHNQQTTTYGTRTIHMLDGKVIFDEDNQ